MTGYASQLAAVDRPLVLRARADVQLARVQFSGQTAYVLKDPLTLELFHLTAEEFFLFEKLKQVVSLKKLQQAFQTRFAPRQISPEQLQQGVNQLHSQGLLLSETSGQGGELCERADRQRRSERWQSCLKLLSFRVGSIDATRTVDGLHKTLGWLYSRPALFFMLGIFVYALTILIGHGSEVIARLPSLAELSQPRYWLLWLITIAAVKVIHELAHAVTCKHFGGRCHEIGLLMLALMPCLYCDVTDVWRLPSKWSRIAVSAAGMLAELLVASVALIVWWHAQSGLLQVWCLSVVIVCSVGTLLVNANPLLRYDGYYILSDLVEVPNLAGRAQGLLPTGLRRWLMAESATADALLSVGQRRGLLIYAIAARIYMSLVLVGIFAVLLTWARPYRLENLVYSLGVISVLGTLLPSVLGVGRVLRNPSQRFRLRRPRVLVFSLMLSLLAAVFFWLPITRSVSGPVVFMPAEGQPVFAKLGGELQFVLPSGTPVKAGDVLVRLSDSTAELTLARQRGELAVHQVRYQQLGTMRAWDKQVSQELPTAKAAVDNAAVQLQQLQTKNEALVIRAAVDGVLVAPPMIENKVHDSSQLAVWSGSPLDERNLGCWVEPGTMLGLVAASTQLDALVSIDQADVTEIQPGQTVRILLESSPVRVLAGEVVQVARRSADRALVDPAVNAGKYHLVQVQLTEQDALLLVGSRGTAKIVAKQTTLSRMLTTQLREMLRLPW